LSGEDRYIHDDYREGKEEKENKKKEGESVTWSTVYSSGLLNHFNTSPHVKTEEPLKVFVNHSFHEPTQEEIRAAEEAFRKLVPILEPKILRLLGRVRNQPFLSTEEICEALQRRRYDENVYRICEGLEKRGILMSRSFYDDQGESARIWWIRNRK
jgi:hypothetical protein